MIFFFLKLQFVLVSITGLAQSTTVSSRQLSKTEIDLVLTESIKERYNISFPIYRVYEYQDKLGEFLLVMTEDKFELESNRNIKGYCYAVKNKNLKLKWTLTDFILSEGNEVSEEHSITFWTKYFKLSDYDNDGIIDPIIVYGTIGMNGYSDGRIKILVYHKGKKLAIRHQNGTLDYERNTQVDKGFYDLPVGIQTRVNGIMNNITENNHGIFPYGWEEAMKNKELKFDEN